MTMLALDWNATRVRGVLGAVGDYPLPVPLNPPHLDLPLAINLAQLTQQTSKTQGANAPRSEYHACELAWRKLHPLGAEAQGIVLTVPGYLQPAQAEALRRLGELRRLPMLGSVPTTLAAAQAGHVEQFWQHSVLVVDVDAYALSLAWVQTRADKVHLIESQSFPHLGLRSWHDRLINTLSDLFVWQHRRDPRDSPLAEQSLVDQLELLTDAALHHRAMQIGVQGQQWFKHLLVHPEQTVQLCQPLVTRVVAEAEHLMLSCPAGEAPRGILFTHQAGHLPGLMAALQTLVQSEGRQPPDVWKTQGTYAPRSGSDEEEDFGAGLLWQNDEPMGGVMMLAPEAPARAAHGWAELFRAGAVPAGHVETIMPLTPPSPVDVGPPRLHCRGRDYLLPDAGCLVGSQFGSQLYFDRQEHPEVAPRHCRIIYDHRRFTLQPDGGEVTLVNDIPVTEAIALNAGDQIRLGLGGPLLRFLGKTSSRMAVFV